MRRTHRAAAMLALSLALVSATTAVAAAAPLPTTGIEDQNDRLLRSLQAAKAERTQAAVELARSMERNLNTTTAVTSPAAIEDRLLRNLRAGQVERSEAAVQLQRTMERDLNRTAGIPLPARVEDQHDRLLRNLQAGRAERTQATVQLARAMERNLAPAPPVGGIAAQPAPRSDPAVPGRDVAVLTTLLVGLIGGLVGGAAAIAGWTAASRRRLHRAASAT
jgi:hypothetical protein